MDFDAVIVAAGTIAQAVLLALLIARRVFRNLPVFVAYIGYGVAGALFTLAVMRYAPGSRLSVWLVETAVDSAFFLFVLIEFGRNVLRYNRVPPPSRALAVLLFVITLALTWLAVRWPGLQSYPPFWQSSLRMMQITTIVQTAAVLTLICWSHFLKLRWPDRELRLVSGMGLWTLVSLGALMLHNDGFTGGIANHWVDLLTPLACLGVLVWWVHYFWMASARGELVERLAMYHEAGGGIKG